MLIRKPKTDLMSILGVLAMLGILVGPVAAQDPDMSDVDDVIPNQHSLIPADDLVAWWPTRPEFESDKRDYQLSPLLLDDGGASAVGSHSTYPEHPECGVGVVDGPIFPGPMQTRIARLFNLPGGEFIVTILANNNANGDRSCAGTNNITIHLQQQTSGMSASTMLTASAESLQLGVGDFDFDGLDDLIVMNSAEAFVASAADTSGQTLALTYGPTFALGSDQTPQNEPAVGDLNADGILDIAWIGGRRSDSASRSIHLASICPGNVDDTVCAGAARFQIILASGNQELESRYGNGRWAGLDEANPSVNVVVGNFDVSRVGDELVLLDQDTLGTACYLRAFEVNATLSSFVQKDSRQVCSNGQPEGMFPNNQLDGIVMTSGPLILYDDGVVLSEDQAAHQVVVAQTKQDNLDQSSTHVQVFSYGPGLASTAFTAAVISSSTQLQIVVGVAIGRFSGPDDFGSTPASTNQQIAVLRGSPGPAVLIYDVASLANLTPTFTNMIDDDILFFIESKNLQGNLLRVGDLQGRSLELGPPEVVRVEEHSQPLVVIGVPPMHADYINNASTNDPSVFNFTVVPRAYNSTYTVDSEVKTNSASRSTTSYTYSKKETVSGGVGFKADGVNAGASVQESISNLQQNTVADTYDTYVTRTFDASSTTGLGDVVWYALRRLNLYNYPILGVASEDGNPQYVTFSVPDNVVDIEPTDATKLEWYQPVHEPANIFSYPWSLSHLMGQYPNLILLSEGAPFATDDTTGTTEVRWSTGGEAGQSNGSTTTQSHSTSESASGSITGTGGGASVDYTASTAYSTLYSDTLGLGASKGVLITKPDTFVEPNSNYQYHVEPYIFGEMLPDNTQGAVPTPPATPATTGAIRTAYVVDPLDQSDGGNWWTAGSNLYRKFPDIAVHHPQRWYSEMAPDTGDECRASLTNTYDCITFNGPHDNLDDVWITPFYTMRGFFITTTFANGDGPQLSQSNAGTDLFLQARVYNYSFTAFASGSTAKINFYRQLWDTSVNEPMAGSDSVLINPEPIDLGQIPPFEGSTDAPNYVLADTVLKTDDLGDTYQAFWVAVWIEKQDGTIDEELPGHGLTEIPNNLGWITDAPFEDYSNNVGFYNSIFYIAGQGGSAATSSRGLQPPVRELRVEDVEVVPGFATLNQPVVVKAQIGAVGEDADGVQVLFVATDLEGNRAIFDEERLSHVAAGDYHQARVLYRPTFCGTLRIEVLAKDTGGFLPAGGMTDLEVECEPEPTPTPTPSATATPTSTPVSGSMSGDDDDACHLNPAGPSTGSWMLLCGACLLALLRRRFDHPIRSRIQRNQLQRRLERS